MMMMMMICGSKTTGYIYIFEDEAWETPPHQKLRRPAWTLLFLSPKLSAKLTLRVGIRSRQKPSEAVDFQKWDAKAPQKKRNNWNFSYRTCESAHVFLDPLSSPMAPPKSFDWTNDSPAFPIKSQAPNDFQVVAVINPGNLHGTPWAERWLDSFLKDWK